MLERGASEADLLEGYPSLRPEHLEAALASTKAHPLMTT
jgi:uncharacterized protein (DUF433 family)